MARVTRAAIVDSETRNARATSSVSTPHTNRRVSATCASRASAGWQQVKMSRNRSSVTTPSPSPPSSTASPSSTLDSTSSGSLSRRVCSRRSASIAFRRAVVVSQAPGFAGTPWRSHACRAETYASWTHSSARSMSRATRAVAASTNAHSRRCASATAAATSFMRRPRSCRRHSKLMIGRTSTPPRGAGQILPIFRAWSRSSASMR